MPTYTRYQRPFNKASVAHQELGCYLRREQADRRVASRLSWMQLRQGVGVRQDREMHLRQHLCVVQDPAPRKVCVYQHCSTLTLEGGCSLFVLMAEIETLGQAFSAKWGIKLRCARGTHRGIVKIDECRYSVRLDVESLVCTRGRAFPLSQLASRMMCPNCGDRRVLLTFEVPGSYEPVFVPQVYHRR
jgi:hypothetical protein